ncbi:trimethylguanosine synthase [Harpegnathos saltator]|uniref:trimethylguanosine synthase n=1 Tax=Harpegnathos saltator TaxID=610380 RepID=UPI00058CEF5B|nr:trimethylguanosine synthase [Harpegnathos saltator]
MKRNNSFRIKPLIEKDQAVQKEVKCDECNSTYVIPHRRQIYRERKGSISSDLPNLTLMGLTFSSESPLKCSKDTIFYKRNIIWKAIKSEETRANTSINTDEEMRENVKLCDGNNGLEEARGSLNELKDRCPSCANLNEITVDDSTLDENDSFVANSDNEIQLNDIINHKLSELKEDKNYNWRLDKSKSATSAMKITHMPDEIKMDKNLKKYWLKRSELFHQFDEGIKLDQESWYSVTPERIALQIARRCKCNTIIDAFCGAGGNTIQFARMCNKVIAIDISHTKIQLAKHNSKIYGVYDKIKFIVGNFFELAPMLEGDVVFLSPPWGGPTYLDASVYDIGNISPNGGKSIYKIAKQISSRIAYYLPRNINIRQVRMLAEEGQGMETEQYMKGKKTIAITCYYGELVSKVKPNDE